MGHALKAVITVCLVCTLIHAEEDPCENGMSALGGARAAFIAGILKNPADDTIRLVFADWLQENGYEARGEFIRLDVQLARMKNRDPARKAALARRNELLEENRHLWFPHIEGEVPTDRGFLNFSKLTPEQLLSHGEELARLAADVSWKSIRSILENYPIDGAQAAQLGELFSRPTFAALLQNPDSPKDVPARFRRLLTDGEVKVKQRGSAFRWEHGGSRYDLTVTLGELGDRSWFLCLRGPPTDPVGRLVFGIYRSNGELVRYYVLTTHQYLTEIPVSVMKVGMSIRLVAVL